MVPCFIFRDDEPSRIGTCHVHCGNTLNSLRYLPACRYDSIITSPPYFRQIDYGVEGQYGLEETLQEYLNTQAAVAGELLRVAKHTATLWWIIRDTSNWTGGTGSDHKKNGDYSFKVKGPREKNWPKHRQLCIPERYRIRFTDLGWQPVAHIIWNKNQAGRGSKKKLSYSYEHILVFSKSQDYYFDRDAVRMPPARATKPQLKGDYTGASLFDYEALGVENPSDRKRRQVERLRENQNVLLRQVWNVPSGAQPVVELPDGTKVRGLASFPLLLAEIMVVLSSPPEGLVLDPYSGMGTTILAAIKHGRAADGIELNPQFVAATRECIRRMR